MKIKHAVVAFLLASLFTSLWIYFEETIYGYAEPSLVDDIMIVFMMPFFYITSAWLEEKCANQKDDTSNEKVVNDKILEES